MVMATGWDRSEEAVRLRDGQYCMPGSCEHPYCEDHWLRRAGLRTMPKDPTEPDRRNP